MDSYFTLIDNALTAPPQTQKKCMNALEEHFAKEGVLEHAISTLATPQSADIEQKKFVLSVFCRNYISSHYDSLSESTRTYLARHVVPLSSVVDSSCYTNVRRLRRLVIRRELSRHPEIIDTVLQLFSTSPEIALESANDVLSRINTCDRTISRDAKTWLYQRTEAFLSTHTSACLKLFVKTNSGSLQDYFNKNTLPVWLAAISTSLSSSQELYWTLRSILTLSRLSSTRDDRVDSCELNKYLSHFLMVCIERSMQITKTKEHDVVIKIMLALLDRNFDTFSKYLDRIVVYCLFRANFPIEKATDEYSCVHIDDEPRSFELLYELCCIKEGVLCDKIVQILDSRLRSTLQEAHTSLRAISALCSQIEKRTRYTENAFREIARFATSDSSLMRAAVCTFIREARSISNVSPIVVRLLHDQSLFVRVEAASAFAEVLQREELNLTDDQIGDVLRILVRDIATAEHDKVTMAIEMLVAKYTQRIAPYAVDLVTELVSTYNNIVTKYYTDEEFDSKLLASCGILKAVGNFIEPLSKTDKSLLLRIHDIVAPVIAHALDQNVSDVLEECFELAVNFPFHLKCVPPESWKIFEALLKSFDDYSLCHLDEMVNVFDNCTSFGGNDRLSYVPMLIPYIKRVFTDESYEECDKVAFVRVIESILLSCPECSTPEFVDYLSRLLSESTSRETTITALSGIMLCGLILNTPLSTQFSEHLRDNYKHIKRVHELRILLLACTRLFRCDPVFYYALEEFPNAVHRRNELIRKVLNDESDEVEDYGEDINFYTKLDDINIKEEVISYVREKGIPLNDVQRANLEKNWVPERRH